MLGIPYRYAVFSPLYLRAHGLPSLSPRAWTLPAAVQSFLWKLEDARVAPEAGWLNSKRNELGLTRISSLHNYLLGSSAAIGAFDPVLAPVPTGTRNVEVTGYWRAPATGVLPGRVLNFLGEGEAPVYLGFGSMRHRDADALYGSLARAVISSGRRLIIGRGWSGPASIPDSSECIAVDDVGHGDLFPRLSMIVHHGGAGTTVAAGAAGVPQIIVPHLGDQYYHGRRVAELGLGPAPIPLRNLNGAALLAAMDAVDGNDKYRQRALEFAPALREREGSARAADVLERLARER
jgi:vancomycin aglycone glucosyltransferase